MFAQISTNDQELASKFVLEHIDTEHSMVDWQRDETGRYQVSVSTDIGPEAAPERDEVPTLSTTA